MSNGISRRSSSVVVSVPRELQELIDRENDNSESHGDHSETSTSRFIVESAPLSSLILEVGKYVYSTVLWVGSIVLVTASILHQQTTATAELGLNPWIAVIAFWFLIAWLSMMEGGQGCLVGLQPIDKESYRTSHPCTYQNTLLAHRGKNLERFIVGRQFLVVLVVFVSNIVAGLIDDAELWNLPSFFVQVTLKSGLALILITISTGQLMSQTNASDSMLDLINNNFMLYFVTKLSLAIEFSGLLHAVYGVAQLYYRVTNTKPKNDASQGTTARTVIQKASFVGRVIMSCSILAIGWAVTLAALFEGKTSIGTSIPVWASLLLFLGLMALVGLLEGLQIALFAVINMKDDELKAQSPLAHENCQIIFTGQNLAAFLIGRQICVTVCMFVVARITTISLEDGDDNLFQVSDGIQTFFNTGLLGALITAIHASLIWRVLASAAPLVFLSNPLTGILLRLCLAVEQSGLCSVAWILARAQKYIFRFRPDYEYLQHDDQEDATHDRMSLSSSTATKDSDVDTRELVHYQESANDILSCSRNSVSRRDSLLSSSLRISMIAENDGKRAVSDGEGLRNNRAAAHVGRKSTGGKRAASLSWAVPSKREMVFRARHFSSVIIDFKNLPTNFDDILEHDEEIEIPSVIPEPSPFGRRA